MNIQYENPYNYSFLFKLDSVTLACMRPYKYCFDEFCSGFFPTTAELKKPYRLLPVYFLYTPVMLILTVLFVPLALLAFLIWVTFQHLKKPYRFSFTTTNKKPTILKRTYCFTTSNFCLLPEFLSRFNNMSNTSERGSQIGRNIAHQQIICRKSPFAAHKNHVLAPGRDRNQSGIDKEVHQPGFDISVLPAFPPTDFFLVQEGSWVREYAKPLIEELHKVYPYVIYDIGSHGLTTNMYISNSGLLFASKYPILKVTFGQYRHSCFTCQLASKGLVMVKVHLGSCANGKKAVGLISNTHMQVYQGTKPIHKHQLDEIHIWTQRFRAEDVEDDEEVMFDVLGGDFNLDNMSPVHEELRDHPIFRLYKDLGRIAPGRDQPWVVGTELRHRPLYDEQISTAEGLKAVLDDPYLRQYYLLDADVVNCTPAINYLMPETDEHGNFKLSPVGGKRRIDYVMFREEDNLRVLGFNPVTQLAGLTDHIPFSLTVEITKG